MNNEIIENLDRAFDAIWLKPEAIPSALAHWQDQLTTLLARQNLDEQQAKVLRQLMDKWSKVLADNRTLLAFHLEHLQAQLKINKNPSPSRQNHAGKFTRQ